MATDSTRAIRGEGMPTFRRPEIKGHLYIKFEIQFPENSFLPYDRLQVCGWGGRWNVSSDSKPPCCIFNNSGVTL